MQSWPWCSVDPCLMDLANEQAQLACFKSSVFLISGLNYHGANFDKATRIRKLDQFAILLLAGFVP